MNKNNTPLIIVIILSIIFFSLIFLSFGNKGIDIKYEFTQNSFEFDINNLKEFKSVKLDIGTITIENSAILPKKVKLNEYVLCQIELNNNLIDNTYYINYAQVNKEYDYSLMYSSRSSNYVEIKSKETKNIIMYIDLYSYNINRLETENLNEITIPLYLFKIQRDSNTFYNYDYCVGRNPNDAIKKIEVKFN